MKSEQVLEAAENLSNKDARSSTLYWNSRKQTLYGIKSKAKTKANLTLMMRFNGVTFMEDGINHFTSRCNVLNKWSSVRKIIAQSDLIVSINAPLTAQLSYLPVRNKMTNYASLATALRNTIAADDYNSPWEVAWDYIVCAYSKEFNTFSNTIKDSMSEFLYSDIVKQFKSNIEGVSGILKQDALMNSLGYFKELLADCYVVQHKLSRVNAIAPLPYSTPDSSAYGRKKLNMNIRSRLNEIHSSTNTFPVYNSGLSSVLSIYNGDKLLSNWKDLCSVFILMGFQVPTPFGLDFEDKNIPALAALFEAADHNLKNYDTWYRDTKTDYSERVTEPTSLLA